jgi:hypothetical protein
MDVVIMKDAQLVIMMDDLVFGILNVMFEAKVFNRYDTFDRIVNKNMEYPSYAYLHYDLFNMVILIIIILQVKSPHINMVESYLQKDMFMRVNFFDIESNSKGDLRKVACILSL